MLAVKVLMQTIVVAGAVLQEQGRSPGLAGGVAALQIRCVVGGETMFQPQALVPGVRDVGERRIERCAEAVDEIGKRILEVLIFAFAEPVPRHHNARSEMAFLEIERRDGAALFK